MQVAKWLVDTFEADPMFRYVFGQQKKKMESFFNFLTRKSSILHEWVVTEEENGVPFAIAFVETPKSKKGIYMFLNLKFWSETIHLIKGIGFRGFSKLNHYMKLTSSVRLKENHYYLVLIGVDVAHQGNGAGKRLLNKIHTRVDNDDTSTGIGLDTENRNNVTYYEHFGYKLVEVKQLGEIEVYCMFRGKNAQV
ncbi:GNAT family N-acetyltransferase [Fusibacter bizertensis]|uniref:GNAT family N-acetyltransferase n=1 Tax=Fusibacter bizertensis TaxID=1488331 RepID=A0ABT6N7W8_9FIRM|nr:GNAT family N-acetyltransferase [Fusibacter bizertensis]MDH8676507.1 GNAT family N-acetyltransferase [Fusibacter bizertensis]